MAMLVLFGMFDKDTIFGEDSFPGNVYIHQTYSRRMPDIAIANFNALFGPDRKEWGIGMYVLRANGAELMTKDEVERLLASATADGFKQKCANGIWWSDFIT